MELVSIQIGPERSITLPERTVSTGIFKEPILAAQVRELGLEGDVVFDTRHHGGPDQAVYVYSLEDYEWWEAELGRRLAPGTFGENFTFSTFGDGEVMIGDRWRIGKVLLETTAPRIPCLVLASKMNDGGFVKRFRAARRPGFYARVIEPGRIESGAAVTKHPSASGLSLMELFDLAYDTKATRQRITRALAAPIAERGRADLKRRLARQS